MAIRIIPVDKNEPFQKFTIDLEGTTYTMRLQWNSRVGRWFLSLLTEDEEAIVTSVPLVTAYNLLAPFVDSRLPLGDLLVVDTTGANREPTDENLGDDVNFIYVDSADAAAILAEAQAEAQVD